MKTLSLRNLLIFEMHFFTYISFAFLALCRKLWLWIQLWYYKCAVLPFGWMQLPAEECQWLPCIANMLFQDGTDGCVGGIDCEGYVCIRLGVPEHGGLGQHLLGAVESVSQLWHPLHDLVHDCRPWCCKKSTPISSHETLARMNGQVQTWILRSSMKVHLPNVRIWLPFVADKGGLEGQAWWPACWWVAKTIGWSGC